MPNGADFLDEAALARREMHNMLDELDRLKRAYEAGAGTLADVNAAATKTHEATDRYFDAMRKAVGVRDSPGRLSPSSNPRGPARGNRGRGGA